jgi:hypothetical protein
MEAGGMETGSSSDLLDRSSLGVVPVKGTLQALVPLKAGIMEGDVSMDLGLSKFLEGEAMGAEKHKASNLQVIKVTMATTSIGVKVVAMRQVMQEVLVISKT